MTINYGGSAGGQPRLFIPTIDLPAMRNVQDPATKKAFEEVAIALNAIKRWSDTLLLGGGGQGLLSYAYYSVTLAMGAGSINPIMWVGTDVPTFSYVTSGLISFPAHSINLIIIGLDENFPSGTDPVTILLGLLGNAGVNQLRAATFTAGLTSTGNEAFDSLEMSYIYNTDGPFAVYAPLQAEAQFSGLTGNVTARLFILSWSIP